MKKGYSMIGLIAFVLGVSTANFAMSEPQASFKVAVVDIQKVVLASQQVANLKQEQEVRTKELALFVDKARKDVAAQSDANKKKELEVKYNKELNAKKTVMDKKYAEKLQNIDKTITKQIETQAKKDNYDIVLNKAAVLSGGTDITDSIIKAVK